MSTEIELVAVVGSVTPPGRLRRALADALARLQDTALPVDGCSGAGVRARATLHDLAELAIPFADGRTPEQLGGDTHAIVEQLAAADAVLLATPVYRGSLTGALKNLLDHVPAEALRGKATALVAIGHTPQHFLGAERHLRDVLAFHGAVVAPVAGYLTAGDFGADGTPSRRAACELDELLAGLMRLAHGLAGIHEPLGPAPIGLHGRARDRARTGGASP